MAVPIAAERAGGRAADRGSGPQQGLAVVVVGSMALRKGGDNELHYSPCRLS